jgi:transcriptional regulator with XRE-family HTH domain
MIAERLKHYRTLRKMSQEELAEYMGFPSNTISKIEHGTRKLTLEEGVRLAEILRITLGELAGVDDSTRHGDVAVVASRCLNHVNSLAQELSSLAADLPRLAKAIGCEPADLIPSGEATPTPAPAG